MNNLEFIVWDNKLKKNNTKDNMLINAYGELCMFEIISVNGEEKQKLVALNKNIFEENRYSVRFKVGEDKYGKTTYEGDLIKFEKENIIRRIESDPETNCISATNVNGIDENNKREDLCRYLNHSPFEVIGNIYEGITNINFQTETSQMFGVDEIKEQSKIWR